MNREQIAARLPHRGAMSLLDEVSECSDQRIVCHSGSHRLPNHPMATPAGLPSAAGIEYAAQAMALHAALCLSTEPAIDPPGHGVLANVRSSVLHVGRLDTIHDDLLIIASLVSGDASGALYQFTVDGDGQRLLDGRATVMFASSSPTGAQPT